MNYKILTMLVIIFLIFSSISVIATKIETDDRMEKIVNRVMFSQKTVTSKGEYLSIDIDGVDTFLMRASKPMLPMYTKTFTFPLGTKIKSVECVILSDINREVIPGKIKPAPEPIPLDFLGEKEKIADEKNIEDKAVYNSSSLFPDRWYDYTIGCGLDDGDRHVIFLTVRYYPVRYSPAENTIYSANDIDIRVTYEEPAEPITFDHKYDLVIIAPRRFSMKLTPLVHHKNNIGVTTILKTTEEIYANYPGQDKQEQIKYFIEDAIEKWGIKYVLLVGGMKGQRYDWHVPVRYSNLDDYSEWETGYISDLYYADVYRYNESSGDFEFEDWDSNGNGIFAEWTSAEKDVLDLYPDVYLGRLACQNIFEVDTVVKKIIKYETSTYDEEWFKKMIVVAGDTFPFDDDYYEGEIETNLSSNYMQPLGFNITRLWTSEETLTGRKDIIQAISQGIGFIHFAGHGNPSLWSTHPPRSDTWIEGFNMRDMNSLKNGYKLPICVVGGCHNSQFNVTLLNIIKGLRAEGLKYFSTEEDDIGSFWKYEWVPECWSWRMISKRNGGAIATIGDTGLGYGYEGNHTLEGLGGWIEPRFFHTIGIQGKTILGEAHGQAITDYVNTFDVNGDRIDRKTVEQWVLLGDPSLKIGGYPS